MRRAKSEASLGPDSPGSSGTISRKMKNLPLSASQTSIQMTDEFEKKSPWNFFRQKFSQKKDSSNEELRDFLEHISENKSNTVEHDLLEYKDTHWMQLIAAKLGMDSYSETISDMETKRCEAVWELFHAEVTYLTSRLLVLREVFLSPMEKAKKFGFLDSIDFNTIFGNLERLIEVSSSFAAQLLKMFDVCSIWDVGKTDAIVQAFSEFDLLVFQEYQHYCLQYTKAKAYLDSLKDNGLFKEFVRWCESDSRCNRLHLSDLLVAPVQHLTKYPLLLKAIKKRTSPLGKDRETLESIISSVEKSLDELEGKVVFLSNLERIQEINNNLIWPTFADQDPKAYVPEFLKSEISKQPCETVLSNPCRNLLLEGSLTLIDSNKIELYVFLFDDMLLLTKCRKLTSKVSVKRRNTSPVALDSTTSNLLPSPKPSGTSQSPKQLRKINSSEPMPPAYTVYKQPIPLDRFAIHDCDEQRTGNPSLKNAFCIVQYNRYRQVIGVYTLSANCAEEKNKWMMSLKGVRERQGNIMDLSDDEERSLICLENAEIDTLYSLVNERRQSHNTEDIRRSRSVSNFKLPLARNLSLSSTTL